MATQNKTYNVGGVQMDRPFKIRRLGHFGFNVINMDSSVDFYRNLLGFKMSDMNDFASNPERAKKFADMGITDTRGRFFHYGGDHHAFVLFPKKTLDAMRGIDSGDQNINQITWQTGSLAEVVNSVEYFQEHEVHINRSGRDMPGSNWHTYVLDVDGHTNELYYGMEQIGWDGRSKPLDMYYRKFMEKATLPQPSEEDEVEEAIAKGIDVTSGFRDLEDLPRKYDVEGMLLARPFKVTKIGPVDIFVDDVDAAVRFYTEELGFTLTEDVQYEGKRFAFLRAGTEHHSLSLWPKSMRAEMGFWEGSTCASFGVEVGSYEQLRNAVAFLKENGVEIRDVPAALHPGVDYAAYAIDPEGHAIQLYCYMENVGWQGSSRGSIQHTPVGEWPETIMPLSDTYADQTFMGPLG
jgi:catechol 2,3-dioxygenase-like lactoylglutathione lyase family enzyme